MRLRLCTLFALLTAASAWGADAPAGLDTRIQDVKGITRTLTCPVVHL